MQSSVMTKPDAAEIDALERRRPGRFDDVSLELVSLLRGDVEAGALAMAPEPDLPPGYDTVSISARDPVVERQTAFNIVMIIIALVGVVLLFGK